MRYRLYLLGLALSVIVGDSTLGQEIASLPSAGPGSATEPLILPQRQKPQHTFRRTEWTTDKGLPRNATHAVVQTRDGYVWIGTRAGLVRSDGRRMKVFDRENTPALVSDDCLSLYESEDGTLWIGTMEGIVYRKAGLFSRIDYTRPDMEPNDRGDSRNVPSVLGDRRGYLWVGDARGLSRMEGGKICDRWHIQRVNKLLEGRDGAIWAASDEGLYKWDAKTHQLTHISASAEFQLRAVLALAEDSTGAIWFGTRGGTNTVIGVWKEGALTTWPAPRDAEGRTSAIRDIEFDRAGNIWLASYGLYRFGDGMFGPVSSTNGGFDGPIDDLEVDSEGSLWLASELDGAYRLHPRRIVTYTADDGLPADAVEAVLFTSTSNLWVGTRGGLCRLEKSRFEKLPTFPGQIRATALAEGKDGRVWVGARDVTLLEGNRAAMLANLRMHHWIAALLVDGSENLWIGGNDLLRHAPNGSMVSPVVAAAPLLKIHRIFADSNGGVWVGALDRGLTRFFKDEITVYTTAHGLPSNNAGVLYEDSEGTLWIGSDSGLARLKDGQFRLIGPRHGLPDNVVLHIEEDQFGNLWISSHKGIYRARKSDLNDVADGKAKFVRCVLYGVADGMLDAECNGGWSSPCGEKLPDGRLLFATVAGLAMVDPATMVGWDAPSPVVIEEVEIDRQLVRGEGLPAVDGMLRLESGRARTLRITYTAANFTAPEKVRFKYQLDGHDTNWVDAGEARVAYYTNLKPGEFRFRVAALNHYGLWSTNRAEFAFSLAPHYYQTPWFYGLCAVALIGTAAAVQGYRLRVQRRILLLQQQAALAQERARIAQDMHDELGSSLTRIQLLGELAEIDASAPPQVRAQMREIAQATAEVTREIDAIVWAVDPRNDRLPKLADYISHRVEEYMHLTPIQPRLEFPTELPDVPISAELRHAIFMAVKEALQNVLKHSQATEVRVRLVYRDERLRVVIADNGRGFETTQTKREGMGLANMRRRVESLDGEIHFSSQPGQGTWVEFDVPLGRSAVMLSGA